MDKTEIEKQYGRVILEFPTYYPGWEIDTTGWIVERVNDKNGKKKNICILTNHGKPYVANKNELKKQQNNIEEHFEKIKSALNYL